MSEKPAAQTTDPDERAMLRERVAVATWHRLAPQPTNAEVEAEVERILNMSDEEIMAEARERGEDLAEARRWGLAIFQAALEEVARGKRP